VRDADEEIVISHNWAELRRFMWDYVGIVRTNKRLERALNRIRLLEKEIDEYYANYRVGNDLIELRNLVLTAHLIVKSALRRHESRGLHFSLDYPETLPRALETVLAPAPALSARRVKRQPRCGGLPAEPESQLAEILECKAVARQCQRPQAALLAIQQNDKKRQHQRVRMYHGLVCRTVSADYFDVAIATQDDRRHWRANAAGGQGQSDQQQEQAASHDGIVLTSTAPAATRCAMRLDQQAIGAMV
jgi:hypothetical protein